MENRNASSNQADEERLQQLARDERQRVSTMMAAARAVTPDHTSGPQAAAGAAANGRTLEEEIKWCLEAAEMERLFSSNNNVEQRVVSVDATPPREVLKCASKLMVIEEPPPSYWNNGGANSLIHLTLLRTIVEDLNHKMVLAFAIERKDQHGTEIGQPIRAATIGWSRDMGSWSAANWAWLIATILKRTGWPVTSINLCYRLQDCPQGDFEHNVDRCYADVTSTTRFADAIADDSFPRRLLFIHKNGIDMEQQNDLAFLFDSNLWTAAQEVGLEVEDRSLHPALTYSTGPSGNFMVIDKTGKRWTSQEAYVKDRLKNAQVEESLTEVEADKLRKFMWEVVSSQKLMDPSLRFSGAMNFEERAKHLQEHAEKILGKRVRKIARKHKMTVPTAATTRSTRRCDHCEAVEGTVRDSNGDIVIKFQQCPCNPEGRPFYCGPECQRGDWPCHKEFCTAKVSSSKSKQAKEKNGNGSNGAGKKKKKKSR